MHAVDVLGSATVAAGDKQLFAEGRVASAADLALGAVPLFVGGLNLALIILQTVTRVRHGAHVTDPRRPLLHFWAPKPLCLPQMSLMADQLQVPRPQLEAKLGPVVE